MNRIFTTALLSFLSWVLMAFQAYAYMDLTQAPELSYGVRFGQEEFEKESTFFKDMPDGNKLLAYEVRVPKGWKQQKINDISNSSALLNDVGFYYGPNRIDVRSSLRVSSQKVDKLMSAEHWFINYLMGYSYTIQGYKRINELRVEAEYVKFDHGKTYYVRANILRNGGRIILTEYMVPVEYWDEEKSYAVWSSILFKLRYLEGTITGGVKSQMFLDISRFSYPLEWEIRYSDIRSLDIMRIELALIRVSEYADSSGRLTTVTSDDGTLLVSAVSNYEDGDVIREKRQHLNRIEEQGFILGEELPVEEEFYVSDELEVKEVKTLEFTGPRKGYISYEMWFIQLRSGGYDYIVSMVTPSREDSFDIWADNIGSLKLILNSFEINDKR